MSETSPIVEVALSLKERSKWNGALRQSVLDGPQADMSSPSSVRAAKQHWDLRFASEPLENDFLSFYMENWNTRILMGSIATVSMLCVSTPFPNGLALVRYLYYASICVFFVATALLVHCKLQAITVVKQQLQHLGSKINDSASRLSLDFPVLSIARRGELISLCGIYGGLLVFTVPTVLGRITCSNEPKPELRRTMCYNAFYFEANLMLFAFLMAILCPLRFPLFSLSMFAICVTFAGANALGPAVAFVPKRFYSSLVVFVAQILACVLWVYFHEREQRNTFLTRLEIKAAMANVVELRRLAVEAAARRVPDHVVRSISATGTYVASGTGIVCGLGLANVGRWIAGRGPCDVVHALEKVLNVFDDAMATLMCDPSLAVTRIHELGESTIFVVLPSQPSGQPSQQADAWLRVAAQSVWGVTLTALDRADAVCQQLELDPEHNHMLSSSSVREVPKKAPAAPPAAKLLLLAPIATLSVGDVLVRLLPSCDSTMVGCGEAVEECRSKLRELQLSYQPSLHLSSTDKFAAMSNMNSMLDHAVISNIGKKNSAVYAIQSKDLRSESIRFMSSASELRSSLVAGRDDHDEYDDTQLEFVEGSTREIQQQAFPTLKFSVLSTTFSDPDVEASFAMESRITFDIRLVRVNAVSMVAFSAAMLVVCAVYGSWACVVRSPFPYVVGSGLCGAALLLCTFIPFTATRCYILEVFYWLFMTSTIAASVMSNQFDSIFGSSLLPWVCLGTTISQQRPRWYGPVAMWSLEGSSRLFGVIYVILPTRNLLAPIRMMTILIFIVAFIFSYLMRRQLDVLARVRFVSHLGLRRTRDACLVESQRLFAALEAMVPNRVAQKILDNGARSPAFMTNNSAHNCRWNVHPLRSTVFSTSVSDKCYALLHVDVKHPPLPSSSPLLRLQPSELLAWVHGQVMDALDSSPHENECSDGSNAVSVVIFKSAGDVLLLSTDETRRQLALQQSSRIVFQALLAAAQALESQGLRTRAIADACPMVGAILGKRAPTFEWYAPQMHLCLAAIRLGAECGPLEWGTIVGTARFCYYYHFFDERSDAHKSKAPRRQTLRWVTRGEQELHVVIMKCGLQKR